MIRGLKPPLTEDQLRPLEPECERVQFYDPLREVELDHVAALLEQAPHVTLRAFGRAATDLEFLRHFPRLRRLEIDLFSLRHLEGLSYLRTDLEALAIGSMSQDSYGKLDLAPIARFGELRELALRAHKRNIEVISQLAHLERIMLRSITLPDLSLLLPARGLRSLDLKLGGTKNLGLLGEFPSLRYLELWRILGLDDLGPVSECTSLQHLFLQDLPRVARLPDLSLLTSLRRITLWHLKALSDLKPLMQAPALTELVLIDMPRIGVDEISPLASHPTLARAHVGLGSASRNAAAAQVLGLPPADWARDSFRFV